MMFKQMVFTNSQTLDPRLRNITPVVCGKAGSDSPCWNPDKAMSYDAQT